MFKKFRKIVRQTIAIIEKNILLELRVKSQFILRILNPLIQMFLMVIIFGTLFNIKKGYHLGYWNANNYILFIFLGFSVQFLKSIINSYRILFALEKYWKTLSAIIVAPTHRFVLLLGTIISELILDSLPLGIILILTLFLYPISLIYIFLVILMFFVIICIFGALGLLLGILIISREGLVPYSDLVFRFLFLFSCINYPLLIFPQILQVAIYFNPLYYVFDLLRLVWYMGINFTVAVSSITPIHIIVNIILAISLPILSIVLFEKIYKKYGIKGY